MSVYPRCSLPEPLQDKDGEAAARLFRQVPEQKQDAAAQTLDPDVVTAIEIAVVSEVLDLLMSQYDRAKENLDPRYESVGSVLSGMAACQDEVGDFLNDLKSKNR